MRKQAKAALLHLATSALLYTDIHQHRIIFSKFLHDIAELFFLSLISPFGLIFLPFGLRYRCSAPHPVNVAIMGFFFALNSYFAIFAAGKINQRDQFKNVAALIFLSAIVNLPFFVLAYFCHQQPDSIGVAMTASLFALVFYFLVFLFSKISKVIRPRKRVKNHDTP